MGEKVVVLLFSFVVAFPSADRDELRSTDELRYTDELMQHLPCLSRHLALHQLNPRSYSAAALLIRLVDMVCDVNSGSEAGSVARTAECIVSYISHTSFVT